MRCSLLFVAASGGLFLGLVGTVRAAETDPPLASFRAAVQPVLAARCGKCHGMQDPEAKLTLVGLPAPETLRPESKVWFHVQERIEAGSMPPEGEPPLSAAEKQAVSGWVRGELTTFLSREQLREGRSRLRRLNREEYANTMHDLFGFRPAVVRELPGDGRVDGYDKVAGALPLSSAGAAGFVKIAEDVLDRMLRPIPKVAERSVRLVGGPSEQSKGHILELEDGTMVSFNTDLTSGPLRTKSPEGKLGGYSARIPGIHRLRLSVYGYQTDRPLPFGIYAGHTGAYPQAVELVKVLEAPPGKPAVVETEVYLRTRQDNDTAPVSDSFRLVPFGIGVQVPKNTQASQCKGPGLAVQWVEVEEPAWPLPGDVWLTADLPDALRDRLRANPPATLKNLPKGTREEFLTALGTTFARIGRRLYRRPLEEAERTALVEAVAARVDAGEPLRTVFLDEVRGMLTSPEFLCLVERPGRLTDFALAARLSYLLWNTTPDEELLDLAAQGRLSDPAVLRAQTERLLHDPKSQRFVDDFVDQWLGLRGIADTTPDADLYPEYDDLLKISSVTETRATFRRLLDRNLGVRELVAPDWALVNERLAAHYGLPPVSGFALREVALPADSPFGGIWTQAATMKVTANGTLTSPVKRGVWVAERLLGIAVPPPPPNIEPVDPDTRGAKTLREQLALHSSKGSCKACHARFDPYGFALESFDVTGAFRTRYREVDPDRAKRPGGKNGRWRDGLPVDCSGVTPDGRPFADVRALRRMLAENPEQLARGVVRHLVTYGTGAPASHLDRPAIDAIVRGAAQDGYGVRTLVHGVVQSELFRSK